MKKLLLILLLAISCGCSSNRNKYVEGTVTQLGLYVPMDGTLMGCEVVNYMNGCKVTSATNFPFKVDRTHSATNDYFWGMVKTIENTHTEVEIKNGN